MNYLTLKKVSLSFDLQNFSPSLKRAIVNTFIRSNKDRPTSVQVLKSISLNLKNGDSLGVLGSNGSGKTTLLRLCSGIYLPDQGVIDIKGRISSLLSFGCGLRTDLLGFENIKLVYSLNWIKMPSQEKIDWIIDFSGLGDAIYKPVYSYSSGMIARLAFSIAVCEDPEILILDEVMGAGDEEFKAKAHSKIMNLMQRAGIVIFASHDMDLIKKYCNKYISLENGKIVSRGKI